MRSVPSSLLGRVYSIQHARLYSSETASTSGKATGLKSHLRSLFRLVHPDLFHDSPYERDINEQSFKALQEYLQQDATETGERGSAVRLRFFIRAPPSSPCPFKEVNASLPPPIYIGKDVLAPVTRKALAKLLSSCGVEGVDSPDSPESLKVDYDELPLREFLREAAEEQRQRVMRAEGGAGPPRVDLMRGAFRMHRGVQVLFASAGTAAQQAEQCARLARALDRLDHVDLRGTRIVFGPGGPGVDSFSGDMWLPSGASAEEIASFLGPLNLAVIREAQRRRAGLAQFAKSAAGLLGLAGVYAAGAVERSPDYRRLLLSWIEYGGKHGQPKLPPGCGDLSSKVSLVVEAPPSALRIDQHLGALVAPFRFPAESADLWAFVTQSGPEAAAVADRLAEERAKLGELKDTAVRQLRLRALLKADGLSTAQFKEGVWRLLRHSDGLVAASEGLVLRLAMENRISEDGKIVDIAWDFRAV